MFPSGSSLAIRGGTFNNQESVIVNVHAGHRSVSVSGSDEVGRMGDARSHHFADAVTTYPIKQLSPEVIHDPRVPAIGTTNQDVAELNFAPSHVIYTKHLKKKGRGSPLWIPQPNLNLPDAYRAQGVRIGDVGLIAAHGGFDFMFNICSPADDPVHSGGRLPDGFEPIKPPVRRADIHESITFSGGSYLASSFVSRSQAGLNGDLMFESSASEGAILALPDDTYQSDLNNLAGFREHVGLHAESWYRFVNGPCGRMAENGDLCLVIGCDKSASWGIATFSNSSQCTSRLQFRQISAQGNRAYTWDHSGAADVRVGPGQGENHGLHLPQDLSTIRNQCLFVRVLKIKLADRTWAGLNEFSGVSIKTESYSLGKNLQLMPRRHGTDRTKEQAGQPSRIPVYKGRRHSGSFPTSLGCVSSVESTGTDDLPIIASSSYITSTDLCPASVINDYLLDKNLDAKMAMAQGHLDTSIFPPEKWADLRSPSDLIAQFLIHYDIHATNTGVAYYLPKRLQEPSVEENARGNISSVPPPYVAQEEETSSIGRSNSLPQAYSVPTEIKADLPVNASDPSTNVSRKAGAKFDVTTEFLNLGLHVAAATGNVGLVEYALEHGQPVNSILDGVLPLHAACASGNIQVVNVLIGYGADVNAPRLPAKYSSDMNRNSSASIAGTIGSTPLHFAAANGNTSVVSLLLLRGAHADRADKDRVTPEMLAQKNGWMECAKVLKEWISKQERPLRRQTPSLEYRHRRQALRQLMFSSRLTPV